jgi:hypothetical protein
MRAARPAETFDPLRDLVLAAGTAPLASASRGSSAMSSTVFGGGRRVVARLVADFARTGPARSPCPSAPRPHGPRRGMLALSELRRLLDGIGCRTGRHALRAASPSVVGMRKRSEGSCAFTCHPAAIVISTVAAPDVTRRPAVTGSAAAAASRPAPSARPAARTQASRIVAVSGAGAPSRGASRAPPRPVRRRPCPRR